MADPPVERPTGGHLNAAISNLVIRVVADYTGRGVIAFFSDNHLEPDMALEAMLLEPEHPTTEV